MKFSWPRSKRMGYVIICVFIGVFPFIGPSFGANIPHRAAEMMHAVGFFLAAAIAFIDLSE